MLIEFTGKAMIPASMRLASNLADRNWVISHHNYMLKNIFHELLIVIDPVI